MSLADTQPTRFPSSSTTGVRAPQSRKGVPLVPGPWYPKLRRLSLSYPSCSLLSFPHFTPQAEQNVCGADPDRPHSFAPLPVGHPPTQGECIMISVAVVRPRISPVLVASSSSKSRDCVVVGGACGYGLCVVVAVVVGKSWGKVRVGWCIDVIVVNNKVIYSC